MEIWFPPEIPPQAAFMISGVPFSSYAAIISTGSGVINEFAPKFFLAIMFSSSLYGFFVLQVLREFTDLRQLGFGLVLFSDRGDHAGVLETCICQISSVLSHRAVIYAR